MVNNTLQQQSFKLQLYFSRITDKNWLRREFTDWGGFGGHCAGNKMFYKNFDTDAEVMQGCCDVRISMKITVQ